MMNRSEPISDQYRLMEDSSGTPVCPPTVPSEMLNPVQLRLPCPCQSSQCQLAENMVELQSSQYHVLTGPTPGPSTSSVSSSWFSEEPMLSNMMVDVNPQGFPESNPFPPMLCNLTGENQEDFLKSVFSPIEAAVQGNSGEEPGKAGVSGQQYEAACSSNDCGAHPATIQSAAATTGQQSSSYEPKTRKRCHCTRSQCLKLYCECFANGLICSGCSCSNCHNNTKHEDKRQEAVKLCLGRNPNAFQPKIAAGRSGSARGRHNKGCNCKRSNCLKNYCECYEANIMCTSCCNCIGCRNFDERSLAVAKEEESPPWTGLTLPVVESVCGRLLRKAREAEITGQEPRVAEQLVLQEFGLCLSQIVENMFGSKPGGGD